MPACEYKITTPYGHVMDDLDLETLLQDTKREYGSIEYSREFGTDSVSASIIASDEIAEKVCDILGGATFERPDGVAYLEMPRRLD